MLPVKPPSSNAHWQWRSRLSWREWLCYDYHQFFHCELGRPEGAICHKRKCLKCGREWEYLKSLEDMQRLMAHELAEAFWGLLDEPDPIWGLITGERKNAAST